MCLRVIVSSAYEEIEGSVPYGTDLDSRFALTDDDGNRYWVNGWCCTVEVVNDHSPCRFVAFHVP